MSLTRADQSLTTNIPNANNIPLKQVSTNQIFTDSGANINKFNDRVFVGGATVASGDSTHSIKDWVDSFYSTIGESQSYVPVSVFNSFTSNNQYSLMGGFFAAQTLTTAANTTAIGLMALGLCNDTANTGKGGWALYTEGHKLANVNGYLISQEFEVRNLGPSIIADPYTTNEGTGGNQATTVVLIGAGCGLSTANAGNTVTVGVAFGGTAKFNTGINFNNGCLDPLNGNTAISFAQNHTLSWYFGASQRAARVYSSANNSAMDINFLNAQINFNNVTDGNTAFKFTGYPGNIANGLLFGASVAGTGYVTISSFGADGNVDILLNTVGSGGVRFGSYVGTPATSSGYIYIKDSGGTLRKLMVGT